VELFFLSAELGYKAEKTLIYAVEFATRPLVAMGQGN
jgi:hypothetical protein